MSNPKKAQKYQNKTAYAVRFNQKKIEVCKNAVLDHLCARCLEQVQWKVQFGKYKPKTTLTRCNKCDEKNINKAYRTVCDKCAEKEKLCAKCGKSKEIANAPRQERRLDRNGVDKDKLRQMEEYMENLRERSKRMILRKLMKGEIEFDNGFFVTKDGGEPMKNLKFKGDIDELESNWDDDEDDDDDDEDDEDDGDDDDDDDDEDDEDKNDKKEEKKTADKPKSKTVQFSKEVEAEQAKKEKKEEATAPAKQAATNESKDKAATQKHQQQKQKPKKKEESEDDDSDDDDDDDDY